MRGAAEGALDARVRHADPARPPHLPAEAALRPLRVRDDCADYFKTLGHGARAEPPSAAAVAPRSRRRRRRRAAADDDDPRRVRALVREAMRADPAAVPRRACRTSRSSSRTSRRRTARRDGHRAARHAVRPLPGHAADRAGWGHGNALPDRIADLPAAARGGVRATRTSCSRKCAETLIHEVGHYFGLSEEEIEEIEEMLVEQRRAIRTMSRGGRSHVKARKRFGQHFLEPAWARKVVDAIAPQPDDTFLEIGPAAARSPGRWPRARSTWSPSRSTATWRPRSPAEQLARTDASSRATSSTVDAATRSALPAGDPQSPATCPTTSRRRSCSRLLELHAGATPAFATRR